ncbi:MAG TPA: sugar phosphate isomerase/epimerase, partial [Limnochordia bacterium]|nr:sugar phosphate isomerase/epimerase [Limnochordia bacterium]
PNIPIEEQVDNIRCLPGETGVIDTAAVLKVLAANGCRAPVTVEPFSAAVRALSPDDAARVTAEALGGVWRAAGLA